MRSFNKVSNQQITVKHNFTFHSTTSSVVQSIDITRKKYTKFRWEAPPEDEQVMVETCRGP
jgi:hypothetical protein